MWRRYVTMTLIIGGTLFLMGSIPGSASAQHPNRSALATAEQAATLSDLAALLRRSFVPVQVYRLDGPKTLVAGEEGLFTPQANVESATFPIRFRWDFGDGTRATSLYARHGYARPGTYTVTFTLYNDGSEATDTLTVTVLPPGRSEAAPGTTPAAIPLHEGR